jgi:hypothetical protein
VGGWSAQRPGRLTPGNNTVPIVQDAGWTPGSVWTGIENLAPTGIRSPDRPARSESLYRLSYRGPRNYSNKQVNINIANLFREFSTETLNTEWVNIEHVGIQKLRKDPADRYKLIKFRQC